MGNNNPTTLLVVFKKDKDFSNSVKEIKKLGLTIKTSLGFIKCVVLDASTSLDKLSQIEKLDCVLECQKIL